MRTPDFLSFETPLAFFRDSIDRIDKILWHGLLERNKNMRVLFALNMEEQIDFIGEHAEEMKRWDNFQHFREQILDTFRIMYDKDSLLKKSTEYISVSPEYFEKESLKNYIYHCEKTFLVILKNRMELSQKIGEYKIRTMEKPVFVDERRKAEILLKYQETELEEIRFYEPLFGHIHDLSVGIQEKLKSLK